MSASFTQPSRFNLKGACVFGISISEIIFQFMLILKFSLILFFNEGLFHIKEASDGNNTSVAGVFMHLLELKNAIMQKERKMS